MFCTTASQGGNGRRVDSSSGALSWQADPVHSISASQIQSVFGSDAVNQLAARMGISPDAMSARLAEVLPGAIDKLTPNGKLPEGGLLAQALSALRTKVS